MRVLSQLALLATQNGELALRLREQCSCMLIFCGCAVGHIVQADMTPWLGSKPDIKKVGEVRRKIKSLRSRLRHRLADKKDLEEVGLIL